MEEVTVQTSHQQPRHATRTTVQVYRTFLSTTSISNAENEILLVMNIVD